MPRYAVLKDLNDPDLRPIALVTEHRDRVRVNLAEDIGIRSEYSEDYSVLEPDGEPVIYRPGTRQYFDHVLLTLGRSFLVAEAGEEDVLSREVVLRLYNEKVVLPRSSHHEAYAFASAGFLLEEQHLSFAPMRTTWRNVGFTVTGYTHENGVTAEPTEDETPAYARAA